MIVGHPVPPCESCHNDTKTVKHILHSCAELNDIRLRCFGDSTPSALEDNVEEDNMSLNTIKNLKESCNYNKLLSVNEASTLLWRTDKLKVLKIDLKDNLSLTPVFFKCKK